MTKAGIALSAAVLLSGCCPTHTARQKKGGGGCSPIVITDGVNLRHRGATSDHDFDYVVMDGHSQQATVIGAAPFTNLYLKSGISRWPLCPYIALASSWTLEFWDSTTTAGTSTRVLTLQSGTKANTVTAAFESGLPVDPPAADQDGDDANGGKKLNHSGHTFNYAVFTNGSDRPVIYACRTGGNCVIEITHD